MTEKALKRLYFEWMYGIMDGWQPVKRKSYHKLLGYLHDTEFTYTIPLDGNRADDGVNLRYRFGDENGYGDSMIASFLDDRPCSVLEMMVALAIRCEEHIMDDPDIGNRTGKWFWDMVANLGCASMNDSLFDEEYVQKAVSRFLNHEYGRNGEGGLFLVPDCQHDLRSVEIWYQMCWYLDSYI